MHRDGRSRAAQLSRAHRLGIPIGNRYRPSRPAHLIAQLNHVIRKFENIRCRPCAEAGSQTQVPIHLDGHTLGHLALLAPPRFSHAVMTSDVVNF